MTWFLDLSCLLRYNFFSILFKIQHGISFSRGGNGGSIKNQEILCGIWPRDQESLLWTLVVLEETVQCQLRLAAAALLRSGLVLDRQLGLHAVAVAAVVVLELAVVP